MMGPAHRGGRPRIREEKPRLGAYVGFRLPDELKQKVDASAAEAGRSLSAETAIRLAATYEEQDALDRAMTLAYGADNAGFIHLAGEIFKTLVPRGEWLVDADAG